MTVISPRIYRAMAVAMALVVCLAARSVSASTLFLKPQGSGVYLLTGSDMSGTAAMNITLTYDAGALGNPRVEQGALIAGSMIAVNPNVPGVIRIAVIRTSPLTGSGNILSVAFDDRGGSANPVTGLSVHLTDINGRPLSAQAQIVQRSTDAEPGERQQAPGQSGAAQTASTGAAQPSVKIPQGIAAEVVGPAPERRTGQLEQLPATPVDQPPAVEKPSMATAGAAVHGKQEGPAVSARREKVVLSQKSVLDGFREFKGPRTQKAFVTLFSQDSLIGSRQTPSPVLSDGKATTTITFVAPRSLQGTPDIALMGAALVSLERDRENTNAWIAVVRPHGDVLEAAMTISFSDAVIMVPLTVAPRVNIRQDGSGKVTASDFSDYLKGTAEKKRSGRDVTGDGKVDYRDDYVFTANYLAQTKRTSSPSASGKGMVSKSPKQ